MSNRLNNFLSVMVFSVPAIGMVAGLASATTISIFLVILLLNSRYRIENSKSDHIFKDIINYLINSSFLHKSLHIFVVWCFCTCFWSKHIDASFGLYGRVFIVIFIGVWIINNIKYLESRIKQTGKSLYFGCSTAIFLFFVEYFTDGILTTTFRRVVQGSEPGFHLSMLDRGCALLAITSWIAISSLIKQKREKIALIFYAIVLGLLCVSDSLASLVGFIGGGIIFVLGLVSDTRIFKLTTIILITGSILIPVFAYNITPDITTTHATSLPESAKHRLFIWNFVTNKVLEKPLAGWGLGSSRTIDILESDYIAYNSELWSPLPLHPHNNILQILLETGLTGLILFLNFIGSILRAIENTRNTDVDAFATSASYACFINYYIIGMISYNIWQEWWICTAVWAAVMMRGMLYKTPKKPQKAK